MPAQIDIDRERIAEFCRRNSIRKLSLFGSVLTDRFGPDSDVDFLVEFEDGATVSLLDVSRMELELIDMLNRDVDLRTRRGLSRYFRDDVERLAEPIYESQG